jgi:hypothetical protein
VHVAEEDDHVVIDISPGVDTAKETDRVVHGMAFGHDDVAGELHRIFVGASGGCREQKGTEHQKGKDWTLRHGYPHFEILRAGMKKGSHELKRMQ